MSDLVWCSRPAVFPVTGLHSDCHLYDCWPLAGRDEKFADLPLTLKRQWLKLAAWLQITKASLVLFSYLHRVSWDIGREAGGVEAMPAFLDILPKLLLSLEGPVFQLETEIMSLCWPE